MTKKRAKKDPTNKAPKVKNGPISAQEQDLLESETLMDLIESGKLTEAEQHEALERVREILGKYGLG